MENAIDSAGTIPSNDRVSLFADLRVTGICLDFEQQAHGAGFRSIAGLDEVGRGCLAGPVVAAACILDITRPLPAGLNDSKKLSASARKNIAARLKDECIAFAVGQIEADEIDQINILEATKKAMRLALDSLAVQADFLLIDALQLRDVALPQRAIIKGDSLSGSIAAASVLAKTFRDELMHNYDLTYPAYGFAKHVGYGTPEHLSALRSYGPCPLHRKSFRGVKPEAADLSN
jgi:ribonuclease HII